MKNSHIENLIGANVRKYEMARIMGVSVRTIENWMIQRMIPYQKIGKIVTFDPVQVRNTINADYGLYASQDLYTMQWDLIHARSQVLSLDSLRFEIDLDEIFPFRFFQIRHVTGLP